MRGAFQNGLRGLMNLKTRAPRAMAAEKHDSTHGTIEQKGRCQEQSRGCPGQRTRLERAVSGEGGRTSRPCRSRRRCRAPQAVGLEVNGKSLFRQHQQEFVGVPVRQGEGVSPHNVAQASGNIRGEGGSEVDFSVNATRPDDYTMCYISSLSSPTHLRSLSGVRLDPRTRTNKF